MFLDKTFNKVKGYIKINVFGFFVERFLNLALKENISLWNIKKSDDATVIAYANIYDYKRLVAIAKKTGCKINIEEKIGVPFFILKHKKRKTFAVFFILIAFAIYFYGLHIWKIDIIGDFDFDIENIREELYAENVKVGALKKSLDIDDIKNDIYMRRHDIAWIGISFEGTTAIVEVVEANLKNENELDNIPCNIVSTKSGMVYKINTLEGTALVESGDMVESGDILIKGIMSSQYAPDRYVNSKGTILLKTWYTDRLKMPFERDIISKTGRSKNKYVLGLKNYKINLTNNDTKFEKYDTITLSNRLTLFGKFELPIELTKVTYQELNVDTIVYTEKQAIDIAKKEVEDAIINKIKNNGEIIDTKIDTQISGDGVTVTVTVECIEETGIKQKLEGV